MPKISALPVTITPTGDDLVAVVQGGVTKKATLNTLPIPALVTDALALKAPLASPALTGTPTAPTAVTATSSTQIATTAFVQQELTAGGSTARSLVVSVRNLSGATMTAGTVVYINGATGNTPTIAKAIATSDTTSAQTIGLVQTSIANNGTGLVVVRGIAGNLDTSALTEGQQLYLSPSVAGTYTTTKQFAPNHLVYIGIVTRAHPNLGTIEVAIQNGYEIDELHNVSAQSPSNGDTLRYNSATSLWEKSALGTLATQSGTFSGTSSGTNTGDQTASTVANTPAGNIAATTVQAAINELDTEKAPLASPALTGNPTAPTPAVTDDDTSIATTAFVQDVQQAEWTQPTAISITGTGDNTVAAVTAQNRYLTQRVSVTAFSGTATVTLQSTNARAGDKRRFIVAMPAGTGNLIELRNLTSGGTLLATVPMDGALARTWLGYSTFDGTNWGAVSFSPLSVDEFVLARAAFRGDYLQSDGATSNRAQIYGPYDAVNNPREWIAGAASYTVHARFLVPTSAPSDQYLVYIGPSASFLAQTCIFVGINTNTLFIKQIGSVGGDNRTFQWNGFRTAYSGQTIFMKITFALGSASPVVEVNAANVSASFSLTTAGTPPAWLDASMVPTYRLVGYNWPSGPAPIVTPILGTTSAADDAFYMQTGRWPAWVVAGGSPLELMPNTGFSLDPTLSASGRWTLDAGVTWDSVSNEIDLSFTGTGFLRGSSNSTDAFSLAFYPTGYAFRVSFEVKNYVSGSLRLADSGGTSLTQTNGVSVPETTSNGVYTYDVISRGTRLMLGAFTGTTNLSIDNVSLKRLGALSLPSIQPINVIDDVSGIGGNQGRVLGGTPVTDKTNWRISANTWTNGNQQILAGSILDSTKDVIDLVEQSTTGTPTTTIGSASAGSQYKASSALTAGINPVTLVTRKLASNDVWVNSNSTAVVRTTITGHIAT